MLKNAILLKQNTELFFKKLLIEQSININIG